MDDKQKLTNDQIEDVKTQADELIAEAGPLMTMYERYREIYFMEGVEKPRQSGIDDNDWKLTPSPSGRNKVTGMKRLLDTSELFIRIKSKGDKDQHSDEIETGLKRILYESGMYRRARIERDASLSAVLYGPVVLTTDSVQDMIDVQSDPITTKRLEKIKRRTPYLIRAMNPEQSYSRWGEIGMSAHLRRYKVRGSYIKERYGVEDLERSGEYTIYDFIDYENRVIWVDGVDQAVVAMPHMMGGLNVVSRYAGGSSLFTDSSQMMQSFLYAHAKGEWDKRENLYWTYIFTALYQQGVPGPLLIVDPESITGGTEIHIDYTGGVRTIIAKAQQANHSVLDRDALEVKRLLDEIAGESMIYDATLGQNIKGSTFSSLAMLSQSGQLPLEDPKEAIEYSFRDIFTHILDRIKEDGMDNDTINPEWIPDAYDMEVELRPKLPQDDLRNAQIAQALGPLVSDKWKLENQLQVNDARSMQKEVIREAILKGITGGVASDPEIMKQMINLALKRLGQASGQPPKVNTQPTAPGNSDQIPPEMMMPPGTTAPGEMMPPGPTPPGAMMPAGEQQDANAIPGSEQMPKTGPMIPPNERQ